MKCADLFQSMTRNIQSRFRAALIAIIAITAIPQCIAQTAPTISGLSPNGGQAGTSVTISGSGFGSTQSTSTVTFNGTIAVARGRNATSWSNTSIVVVVPAGATSGGVIVKVGTQASNPAQFTVGTAITGISPSSGTPGTMLTVNGVGFGATQGSSTITFNGVAASPTSWSDSSIAVPVPNSATSGNVVITVGSLASNGMNFTVVAKSAATIALSSSAPTSIYGSSVSFTAAVTGSSGAPTGAVSFLDNGASIGSAALNGGTATISISSLDAGSHSVTASYGGDANYIANSSSALTESVVPATTTMVLNPSSSSIFIGYPVTLTATVTPAATGTVLFSEAGSTLGTVSLTNGRAVLPLPNLMVGSHNITASFAGNRNSGPATDSTIVLVKPLHVSIHPSASPCCSSNYGDPITFSAKVTVNADTPPPSPPPSGLPDLALPTGMATFNDTDANSSSLGMAAVGVATTPVTSLSGGPHTVQAMYTPDHPYWTIFQDTTPDTVSLTVNPVATTIQLTANPASSSNTGQSVTFTATVTGVPGGATPTGSVVFTDTFNGTPTQLGKGTVGNNGQATTSSSFNGAAAAGQHSIQAVYNQDNTDKNYQSSTSNTVQQTVIAIPTVTSMTPDNGPAGMGFTLKGTTFGNTAGTVKINGASATILQWNDMQITLQVPTTGKGPYTPVITTSDGKMSDPNSKSQFTVRDRIVVCQP